MIRNARFNFASPFSQQAARRHALGFALGDGIAPVAMEELRTTATGTAAPSRLIPIRQVSPLAPAPRTVNPMTSQPNTVVPTNSNVPATVDARTAVPSGDSYYTDNVPMITPVEAKPQPRMTAADAAAMVNASDGPQTTTQKIIVYGGITVAVWMLWKLFKP